MLSLAIALKEDAWVQFTGNVGKPSFIGLGLHVCKYLYMTRISHFAIETFLSKGWHTLQHPTISQGLVFVRGVS